MLITPVILCVFTFANMVNEHINANLRVCRTDLAMTSRLHQTIVNTTIKRYILADALRQYI